MSARMVERLTADEYAARLLALADRLYPGEALAVTGIEVALACSMAGGLRIGLGWTCAWHWPRKDPAVVLGDHLAMLLDDPTRRQKARRDLDAFLAAPVAMTTEGIGRRSVWFDVASARRLDLEELSCTCGSPEWHADDCRRMREPGVAAPAEPEGGYQ